MKSHLYQLPYHRSGPNMLGLDLKIQLTQEQYRGGEGCYADAHLRAAESPSITLSLPKYNYW